VILAGRNIRVSRLDSIVEIKRIRGPTFNITEAAEEHGLKAVQRLD
jgi:hypothetical protein